MKSHLPHLIISTVRVHLNQRKLRIERPMEEVEIPKIPLFLIINTQNLPNIVTRTMHHPRFGIHQKVLADFIF